MILVCAKLILLYGDDSAGNSFAYFKPRETKEKCKYTQTISCIKLTFQVQQKIFSIIFISPRMTILQLKNLSTQVFDFIVYMTYFIDIV